MTSESSGRVVRGLLSKWWPVAVSLALAATLPRFGILPFAALAMALAASWLAYVLRRLSLTVLVVSVLIPQLLYMLQLLPEGWDTIAGGLRISDVILVGMWGAVAARIVTARDKGGQGRQFVVVSVVLASLLLVAVARNWGQYGLSALGEFRSRYLVLGLPVYVALLADTSAVRAWFTRLLAWTPVMGAILVLPLAAAVKGWGLGEAYRFFPSWISLALLFAGVWMGLMSKGPRPTVPRTVAYGIFAFVALVIVKDAHRSVWLVAAVCLVMLIATRVVDIRHLWWWAAGAAVLAAIALVVPGVMNGALVEYVVARGRAFFNPAEDPTSYWRLSVWKAYMQPFLRQPLFGQGFGGYWSVYVPELGARVVTSPHSVYVQTLVKAGLVGLAALLAWFYAAFRALARSELRGQTSRARQTVLVLGLVAVAGSLTFGAVYPLDFWLLAWMGLALAELFHGDSGEEESV